MLKPSQQPECVAGRRREAHNANDQDYAVINSRIVSDDYKFRDGTHSTLKVLLYVLVGVRLYVTVSLAKDILTMITLDRVELYF